MNPIVIIGSGMAGYTLAREFRRADTETPLTVITRNDGDSYTKPALSNALATGKTPDAISMADAAKMQDTLNLTVLNHTRVQSADTAARTVQIEQNGESRTIEYSKLVLAVGADVIRLPLQGDATDAVLWVNDLDDYRQFRTRLAKKESNRVAIIGAGLIGCEFANDLTQAGHSVSVIDLAERPLSKLLPADVSDSFSARLKDLGVHFALGTSVKSVNAGAGDHALHIALENGETLEADILLSAVGLKPSIELAQAMGVTCNRGIVVDGMLQTSAPDVYAMGDCAEAGGHVLPYVMPLMQQARALAKTLAGESTPLHYPAMPVGVKTPAAPLVVLPVLSGAEVTWASEATGDGLIAKATDADGTLHGFVLLGKESLRQRMVLSKQVPDVIAPQG